MRNITFEFDSSFDSWLSTKCCQAKRENSVVQHTTVTQTKTKNRFSGKPFFICCYFLGFLWVVYCCDSWPNVNFRGKFQECDECKRVAYFAIPI